MGHPGRGTLSVHSRPSGRDDKPRPLQTLQGVLLRQLSAERPPRGDSGVPQLLWYVDSNRVQSNYHKWITLWLIVKLSATIIYPNKTLLHDFIAGAFVCTEGKPLGMEDGRIPNDSITASSIYHNRPDFIPGMARLNTRRE